MENEIRSSKIYEDIAQTITSNFNGVAKKNDFILNFFSYLVASIDIEYSYIKEMSESANGNLLQWIKQNLKVKGKTVFTSEGIGIIQDISSCQIVFSVMLNEVGDLLENVSMVPSASIREATEEEMCKLQAAINQRSLIWNKRKNKLYPYTPVIKNKFVKVSILGNHLMQGIFKEINEKNEIVLYVKYLKGKGFKYSLNEVVGNASFFQIQYERDEERKLFLKKMEERGIKWNGFKKRIEPTLYQIKFNHKYFYIDDCGEINLVDNKLNPKDYIRHNNGNFFRYRKSAEELKCFHKHDIKPKIGDIYFYINDSWGITKYKYKASKNDNKRLECGNFFLNKELAEKTLNELIEKRNLQLSSSKL